MLTSLNMGLAAHLAWRSLHQHRIVALATVLGVAIGMSVVGSILIVDHNSARTRLQVEKLESWFNSDTGLRRTGTKRLQVWFERAGEGENVGGGMLPTQKGAVAGGLHLDKPPTPRGEEDYQAMRLAVRLASVMTFAVGAVIVFFTMHFSVAARGRELCLLMY